MTEQTSSTAFTEEDFEQRLFELGVEAGSGVKFFGHTAEEQARRDAVLAYGLRHFPNTSLSPERLASANEAAAALRRGIEQTAALRK